MVGLGGEVNRNGSVKTWGGLLACLGHRQVNRWAASEIWLMRVGGRDDDTCLLELRRLALLPLPYRGVRVRSATNVVALRQFSCHVEAAPPAEDCHLCVGRRLAGPGAVTDGETVAQGLLPPGARGSGRRTASPT